MVKLTTKTRDALPDSAFALPGRRWPLNDVDHARSALGRAKTGLDKGWLSKKDYDTIIKKARKVIDENK